MPKKKTPRAEPAVTERNYVSEYFRLDDDEDTGDLVPDAPAWLFDAVFATLTDWRTPGQRRRRKKPSRRQLDPWILYEVGNACRTLEHEPVTDESLQLYVNTRFRTYIRWFSDSWEDLNIDRVHRDLLYWSVDRRDFVLGGLPGAWLDACEAAATSTVVGGRVASPDNSAPPFVVELLMRVLWCAMQVAAHVALDVIAIHANLLAARKAAGSSTASGGSEGLVS